MHEWTFDKLNIRLGHPYLFVHQGDCEHLMVFSDLRMFNSATDNASVKDYPKFLTGNRRTQTRCGLCNLNTAKWLTFGDTRLPQEPFYFCETCYIDFEYDENNEKVVNFKAFPYLDRTALL